MRAPGWGWPTAGRARRAPWASPPRPAARACRSLRPRSSRPARAESPVVAFCGEHPTNDQEYNQRLDQARFAAGCEAGFVRVNTPDDADDAVRKAFYLAKMESRPVMLSAPMDIQQKAFEDDDEPYKPSSTLIPPRAVRPDPEALEAGRRHRRRSEATGDPRRAAERGGPARATRC